MATLAHLGLEITDSSIKYFELKKDKNFFIGYFGKLPLPLGLFEAGSIRDGQRLKNILSDIRGKGKWKDVTVSHLPDQVYLADLLKEAGFKNIYFESSGEAVARAAMLPKKIGQNAEADMIVYFTGEKMDIYAGYKNSIRLLTTLNFSSILFAEMRDQEIIFSFIKEKIDEQYISWHTHKEDGKIRPKIKKIILAGELSKSEELSDYLGKRLKLEVGLANVWVNIFTFDEYIPEINFHDSLRYAAAIGLALRSLEK